MIFANCRNKTYNYLMICLEKELTDMTAVEVAEILASRPYMCFFDSADQNHPAAHYSYVMCDPAETIISSNDTNKNDPFKMIQNRLDQYQERIKHNPQLPPFQGGAAGYFGYDLGRSIEKLPRIAELTNMPDMIIGIYLQIIAFDHRKNKAWIITHAENESTARAQENKLLKTLCTPVTPKPYQPIYPNWKSNMDAFTYLENVKRAIAYIHAGDIFQANIAQRFETQVPEKFCAFTHYKRLRQVNAAPFAGYMNAGEITIASASPERFLTLDDRHVETRPIKGTRPRGLDVVNDDANKIALTRSEKDRAENTMIVDLMRNDLSKVCEAHSIDVRALCALESFISVHHLVSTITGTLKQDKTALDLLRACFPGGSITGAPKIRAMEIIETLEPVRRGPYCGSMAYIGFNGTMDSNILIRTLIYEGSKVHFHTGGGIVFESDPDAEYEESFDKASAIFTSFEDNELDIDQGLLALAGTQNPL